MRIVTLLVATAAIGFSPTALAQSSQKAAKPEREKRICKSVPATTGSRLGRASVCRTARQWEAIESRQFDIEDPRGRSEDPYVSDLKPG